jgi:predicted nucleotidyltransferase
MADIGYQQHASNHDIRTASLEAELRAFAQRWGLRRLALFGSILRDDFRPDSDVDVLIERGPDTPRGFRARFAMQDELEAIFGRPVDLVYESGLVNPFRRRAILATAQTVYAAA